MKLVSLNVGLFEKNNDKVKSFLSEQKPDVVCLQEVTRRVDQSTHEAFVSMPAIDAATTDLPYSFFGAMWQVRDFKMKRFHKQEIFEIEYGGFLEFGNYVRSRYPIAEAQNTFVQNCFTYRTNWDTWPEDDCRAFQVVDVLVEGKPLRLINYHGVWSQDKQGNDLALAACQRIKMVALEAQGAVVIAGDFNLFPETKAMQQFGPELESLVDRFEVKTTRPQENELSSLQRNVVDYVWVNDRVKVTDFVVVNSEASDHLPLVVEFEVV